MIWLGPDDALYEVTTVNFPTPVIGPVPVYAGRCWLMGWTMAELVGTDPAFVALFDGDEDSGNTLAWLSIAAGGSSTQHPGIPGWPVETGLTIDCQQGQVQAVLVIGIPK